MNGKSLQVYFGDALHLSIDSDQLIGVQSYFENENWLVIEFYTKARTIRCEYATIDKWKAVLKAIKDYV